KSSTYCQECEREIRRSKYKRKLKSREFEGDLLCRKCDTYKSHENFSRDKSDKFGRSNVCKSCRKNKYISVADKYTKWCKDNNKQYDRNLLRRFYSYPNQCKRRGIQ